MPSRCEAALLASLAARTAHARGAGAGLAVRETRGLPRQGFPGRLRRLPEPAWGTSPESQTAPPVSDREKGPPGGRGRGLLVGLGWVGLGRGGGAGGAGAWRCCC